MADEIWRSERRLWLEGADAFLELLHPDCIVVFGAPVGIIQGDAIAASVRDAPRWTEVEMINCATANQDGNTIAIAYEARGRRGNSAAYRAYCSSTYVRRDSAWRIIQHQQTAID